MSVSIKTQDLVGRKVIRLSGDETRIESVGAKGYKVAGQRKQIPANQLIMFERNLHEIDFVVNATDIKTTEKGYITLKNANLGKQYLQMSTGGTSTTKKQKASNKKPAAKKPTWRESAITRFSEEVNPAWFRKHFPMFLELLGVDESDAIDVEKFTEKSAKLRKLRIEWLCNDLIDERDLLKSIFECMVAKDYDGLVALYEDDETEDYRGWELASREELEKYALKFEMIEEEDAEYFEDDELRGILAEEFNYTGNEDEDEAEEDQEDEAEEDQEDEAEEDQEDEAEDEDPEYDEVDDAEVDGEELADIMGDEQIEFEYPKHELILTDGDIYELDLTSFSEADTDERANTPEGQRLHEILRIVHGMSRHGIETFFRNMFANVADVKVQTSNTRQDGLRGLRFDVGVTFDDPTLGSSLISDKTLERISEKVSNSDQFNALVSKKLGFNWAEAPMTQLTDNDLEVHFILVGGTPVKNKRTYPVLQVVGHNEFIVLKSFDELDNLQEVDTFDYFADEMCDVNNMTRHQLIEYMQARIKLYPEDLAKYRVMPLDEFAEEVKTILSKIYNEDDAESFGSVGGDVAPEVEDEDDFSELDADFDSDELGEEEFEDDFGSDEADSDEEEDDEFEDEDEDDFDI